MFRENILEMGEYKPPLEGREGYLLLDFNERTVPPPKRIRRYLVEYSETGSIHVYPEYGDLDQIIANYAGVKREQVLFTNGSDQGIDIIFRATVNNWDKVIIPSPSFAMFYQSADIQGAINPTGTPISEKVEMPRYIPKGEDLFFPLEEVLDTIDKDTRLVVVCNPNNPTGTVVSREDVEKILKRAKEFNAAVLSDEAYHEFNPSITARDLIDSYDNLFVSRSFSKVLGIAALRAGYVMSQEGNILQLRKIRGPYDCNMEAVAVVSALGYKDTIREMMSYIKEVMEEAKPKTEEFLRNKGMIVYRSGANFILVDPSPIPSEEIFEFLKSYKTEQYKGIRIRPRSDPPNTFRLTIGTNENMDLFMEAFTKFLKSRNVAW